MPVWLDLRESVEAEESVVVTKEMEITAEPLCLDPIIKVIV